MQQRTSGRVKALRVHDVGTGFGPGDDFIDVEVVIRLDSQPGKSYGFQLRDGNTIFARQDMLDILRDAFNDDRFVEIVYDIEPGKNNGILRRVSFPTPPEVSVKEVPSIVNPADDPVVKGDRIDAKAVLDLFPDSTPKAESPPGAMDQANWLPIEEHTLAAGAVHEITTAVAELAVLLARATWHGSATPVEMAAALDGVVLATGEATAVPPNSGTVLLRAEIKQAGNVTITVTNTSSDTVDVEIVAGFFPVSALP